LLQDRIGEFTRLIVRSLGFGDERLSYEANDWLMRMMRRECRRSSVTAVHAYEDCSFFQFAEAKRLGKACIYDMPIGYYPAWEDTQAKLARRYEGWFPAGGLRSSRYVRPEQKKKEMQLADLVLAPSGFVEETIRSFHPHKPITRAAYGVDSAYWCPGVKENVDRPLRFIYAGQLSLRKGTPLLLEAWEQAGLPDAELELVGSCQLELRKLSGLPSNVGVIPPCSRESLREHYRAADVFVFPSFFEGLALVQLEALACGLPLIASDSGGASEILDEDCGRVLPTGDLDALVEALRWFAENRSRLPVMSRAARARAEQCSWDNYRESVSQAVAGYV
jgi:glycosyltransferase involved in cell wall biosynthesis